MSRWGRNSVKILDQDIVQITGDIRKWLELFRNPIPDCSDQITTITVSYWTHKNSFWLSLKDQSSSIKRLFTKDWEIFEIDTLVEQQMKEFRFIQPRWYCWLLYREIFLNFAFLSRCKYLGQSNVGLMKLFVNNKLNSCPWRQQLNIKISLVWLMRLWSWCLRQLKWSLKRC